MKHACSAHFHLVLTGLGAAPEVAGSPTPALRRLLGAGSRCRVELPLEAMLCSLFKVEACRGEWPLGALAWLGEGRNPDGNVWLRADPVYFQLLRDSFAVIHPLPAPLTGQETNLLMEELNRHFAPQGLVFEAPDPQRWYLRLENMPALNTHALSEVVGADVGRRQPSGADAPKWRALLNELQMLLHDHPVNLQREAQDRPPVNSVWLHGAGRLPATAHSAYQSIQSDDALLRGLAQLAGVPCAPVVGVGQESASALALTNDPDRGALETQWFAPLLSGLRQRRWGKVTLDFAFPSHIERCCLTTWDIYKFWRRPVALEDWFG